MEENEMILFTKDKIHIVLNALGVGTQENGFIINPDNRKPAICEACETPISIDSVGHIAHGSSEFYCKNPACFGHFIAKRRLW